jgi:hypothetical protein
VEYSNAGAMEDPIDFSSRKRGREREQDPIMVTGASKNLYTNQNNI